MCRRRRLRRIYSTGAVLRVPSPQRQYHHDHRNQRQQGPHQRAKSPARVLGRRFAFVAALMHFHGFTLHALSETPPDSSWSHESRRQRLRRSAPAALPVPVSFALAEAPLLGRLLQRLFFFQTVGIDQLPHPGDQSLLPDRTGGISSGSCHQQHHLPPQSLASSHSCPHFRRRAAQKFLMQLGQLTGQDDVAPRAEHGFHVDE